MQSATTPRAQTSAERGSRRHAAVSDTRRGHVSRVGRLAHGTATEAASSIPADSSRSVMAARPPSGTLRRGPLPSLRCRLRQGSRGAVAAGRAGVAVRDRRSSGDRGGLTPTSGRQDLGIGPDAGQTQRSGQPVEHLTHLSRLRSGQHGVGHQHLELVDEGVHADVRHRGTRCAVMRGGQHSQLGQGGSGRRNAFPMSPRGDAPGPQPPEEGGGLRARCRWIGQSLRRLVSNRRISRYSHTIVTISPKAKYQAELAGAPTLMARSI